MTNRKRTIKVIGAREHNLKNITVEIPKDTLTVITGPSGSGKSTLALDVLYAEGQRRYMESLSSYARQFLGMPKRPDVDRIEGLCPAIAIDQKTVGANPRSTVGTITEIYDYLRVLFARIGIPHCPRCTRPIQAEAADTIAHKLLEDFADQFMSITAPLAHEKKGEFSGELEKIFMTGYHRFIIDGQRCTFNSLQELRDLHLKKTFRHSIDILIDSLKATSEELPRLQEALEKAYSLASGSCKVLVGAAEYTYSAQRMCLSCNCSFPELEPRFFSFNSPLGACKDCHGLGISMSFTWPKQDYFESIDLEERPCQRCKGKRLHDLALAVTIGSKNIYELGQLSLKDALDFFTQIKLSESEQVIAERLLYEIKNRLTFLSDVGLDYLSLNRTARTLSGGEGQRIRLATQIGSALSGVLYVLDEPSIGLHQRDNDRLIATLKRLRDQGNTVVVVEHDHDTMLHADHLIDMGPAAGIEGGAIVASGTPTEITANPNSLTGAYLAGRQVIKRPTALRQPRGFLTLKGAVTHNLKDLIVQFPLGVLCGISGVSGSGKSTLIMHELVPLIKTALNVRYKIALENTRIEGIDQIEDLVVIDQSPIGRTPRSNPATYLGIFDDIRSLFARTPEAIARGYTSSRFSFNTGQGRCSKCNGEGTITVSMHFLPNVTMLCTQCKGTRYNAQTLEITYKNKTISDVLAMTAYEAAEFFSAHSALAKRLKLLCDVGLDYIKLGQPSTTLSGGEAQRIKLVFELAKRGHNTLYILDEPTTGLHTSDIAKLLHVFDRLIDKGNTVLVIEHNLDVLKTVDYLIDLGPEGGQNGGSLVTYGTPDDVAACSTSYTGHYLKKLLRRA